MNNNNKHQEDKETRLARSIASTIITVKQKLAKMLNRKFNGFSIKKQKWVFAFCCAVGVCSLVISLLLSIQQVPLTAGLNETIRQPGVVKKSKPKPNHSKTTDSLTIKRKDDGKSTANRQGAGTK